jgi:hypothetical protein
MACVVAESTEAATRALRNETEALSFERRNLADIVGHARARDEQKRVQYWIADAGVAAGLVLFPLLGAFAPGGDFLAMLAAGSFDRWQAGVSFMQAGDPVASRSLARASRIMNANSDALKACWNAAQKAGKEQKCTISVAAEKE